jgi:hypothetical protein
VFQRSGVTGVSTQNTYLIPILWLRRFWIRNSGLVNPGVWLAVLGIIDFLGWVKGWREILEKVNLLDLLAVQLDDGGVIGVDNQSVELGCLDDSCSWGSCKMLLLILTSLWVLVVDDQVNLVGGTALVGTEHDNVWGSIGEFVLVEGLIVTKELHVSTTTLKAVCEELVRTFGGGER